MNKNSFLDALRNIFKKARVADVESIIEVYEEHFAVGYEKGLPIVRSLKSLGSSRGNICILRRCRYHYRYNESRW